MRARVDGDQVARRVDAADERVLPAGDAQRHRRRLERDARRAGERQDFGRQVVWPRARARAAQRPGSATASSPAASRTAGGVISNVIGLSPCRADRTESA